jgi:hypothetical protein
MEALKLIASLATPLVVAIFGVLLLRRVEGIKAEVTKLSDFEKRWADGFFITCQEFMTSVERCMTLFCYLPQLPAANQEFHKRANKEIVELLASMMETKLRFRRYVTLAHSHAGS